MNDVKEDAAWAELNTPLSVTDLILFCQQDVERLFRINPMLEFNKWKKLSETEHFFSGRNISQKESFDFKYHITTKNLTNGIQVDYDHGIKSRTIFSIKVAPQGSKLIITEHYDRLSATERQTKLHKVDQSITIWASYLQKYLLTWKRWSHFKPWRWYMSRIWQPMKPAGRRITYMLLWISVVEVALILLGTAIYFIEYR